VTKPGGVLNDGTDAQVLQLIRQDFEGLNLIVGEQGLYIDGKFPREYQIRELDSSTPKATILAGAKAWKIGIGSSKERQKAASAGRPRARCDVSPQRSLLSALNST
jgi:hypothetical protein